MNSIGLETLEFADSGFEVWKSARFLGILIYGLVRLPGVAFRA